MTNEDQAAFAAAMDLMNYALADGKPSALTPDAQHDRTQKAFWVEEVRMLERSLTNAEASLRAAAHNHVSGIKPRGLYEAARHYAKRCDELTDARVALLGFSNGGG